MTFDERLAALGIDLSDLPQTDVMIRCRTREEMVRAYMTLFAEILDRMETRLDNVIGEREYLLDRMWGENPCVICENAKREGGCAVDICEFEFAGVPEDWRAHDA